MSDDVKDLLDRAAADSLRGVHLDLPTSADVALSAASSSASGPDATSVPATELVPLDDPRRRARWPLGLAAAVLALLAIGGGLLAVQSADDPSPASVPTGDPRQRLLDAVDASVADVFEVHYEGITEDRSQAADGEASTVTVWDGDRSGAYVNRPVGPSPITMIDDGTTSYFQTGPDHWVSTSGYEVPNPLRDFGQGAESTCVFDRDGTIVVDLVNRAGSVPPRDPPEQTPCGSASGIQYEVTLDSAGRIATIRSDTGNSLAMTRFEYSGLARLQVPDPSQVTTLPDGVGPSADPVTGYWTLVEANSVNPGPTTTVVSEVGGP